MERTPAPALTAGGVHGGASININIQSPLAASQALSHTPAASDLTTIVDGMDLCIAPDSLREDPLLRSAVSSGLFGKVHFLWPEETALSMLSVTYTDLTKEQVRRLLAALGPRTIHDKTLSFVRDAGVAGAVIPGAVSLRAVAQGLGRWTVTMDCPARPSLYASGGSVLI